MTDWILADDIKDLTVTNYHSFVYRITLPNGEWYVGKKKVWVESKKKIKKESNWKDYWSSSKDLQARVTAAGEVNCKREIIKLCVSAGEASWLELKALIETDAMLDSKCLNANVLMSFHKKVIQGYSDDGRRERYLKDIQKQKKAAGIIKETDNEDK